LPPRIPPNPLNPGGDVKRSDVPDEHVIELAHAWRKGGSGVVGALVAEGVPEKVALRKVEHLIDRGLMDCGVSPYFAWPTDAAP
jgi:hypothetical protein